MKQSSLIALAGALTLALGVQATAAAAPAGHGGNDAVQLPFNQAGIYVGRGQRQAFGKHIGMHRAVTHPTQQRVFVVRRNGNGRRLLRNIGFWVFRLLCCGCGKVDGRLGAALGSGSFFRLLVVCLFGFQAA